MSEKSVVLHEEITSSQADTVSVVGSARTHFAVSISLHGPLKGKFLVEVGEENPGGVPEQLVNVDLGETDEDAETGADIECEGVDVVCGAPALAISAFKLQGFIISQVVHKKRLDGPTLSEGVFDTARPPQCEFSNLQPLPLTFYLDFPAGRS